MNRKATASLAIVLVLAFHANTYAVVTKVRTTGYNAGFDCTGKTQNSRGYGRTKSGISVFKNPYVVAGNTRLYRIGSIVYIEGIGYRIVADTGGFSRKHPTGLDVYFNKTSKWIRTYYGVKWKRIAIVRVGFTGWTNTDVRKHFNDWNSSYARESGKFYKLKLYDKKPQKKVTKQDKKVFISLLPIKESGGRVTIWKDIES